MRFLSLAEVLLLHERILEQSGGASGLKSLGSLESAVAQPGATFDGEDLYPTLEEKAAALCFSRVSNHAFADGNKRVAHAAMETFLVLDRARFSAPVAEQEMLMLGLASGQISRERLVTWLRDHVSTGS